MNFKKLQEMQRALDDAILKEKPEITAEERFEKTCVALSVEIAELANTAEHFKFWKENKGKIDDESFIPYGLKRTNNKKTNFMIDTSNGDIIPIEQAHKLTLVEEASDCLHFILSLANQLGFDINQVKSRTMYLEEAYIDLQWRISTFQRNGKERDVDYYCYEIISSFFTYVGNLGILLPELEQAYYDKNEINYQRLREGY